MSFEHRLTTLLILIVSFPFSMLHTDVLPLQSLAATPSLVCLIASLLALIKRLPSGLVENGDSATAVLHVVG